MKKYFVLFIFLSVFLPKFAFADVKFTEVAWMGTANSQYEEWIEIYNDGDTQSLSGWKIYKAGGGTLLFSLSGNITAGKYLVVCRTTPSVSNPLSGDCDLSGSFGGSGLNNTSEHLVLKDSSGNTVDEINAEGGWPGGDASTKETMQLSGSGWVTAAETHGAATSSGGGGGGNNEDNNTTDTTTTTNDTAASDSGEATKVFSTQILKFDVPKKAYLGDKTPLTAQAYDFDRTRMMRGVYVWNMGNGDVLTYAKTNTWKPGDTIYYTYDYPGTYTVTVKFFETYFDDVDPDIVGSFTIDVIKPVVSISKIYPDGAIEIKNTSSEKLDLSLWQIRNFSGETFTIPKDTLLAPSKTIVFSPKVTKIYFSGQASILSPVGVESFVYGANKNPVKYSYSKAASASSKEVSKEKDSGDVLGAATVAEEPAPIEEKPKEKNHSFIFILSFILLVGLSAVAIIFLRKNENTNEEKEDYKLLDE